MTTRANNRFHRYTLEALLEMDLSCLSDDADDDRFRLYIQDLLYSLDELDRCHQILDDAGVPRAATALAHGEMSLQMRIQYLADRLHTKTSELLGLKAVQRNLM